MPFVLSRDVIFTPKRHFCRYGIPKCVVSDCGRQFVSDEFARFCTKWSIVHYTSSPGHQQSNGKAEAAVKTYKTMLKRTSQQHENQCLALLELRNTPRQDLNTSPAEIVFGRSTRTVIPMRTKKCENFAFDRRSKRRNAIKCSCDKCRPTKTPLHVLQNVYFQSPGKEGWKKGKIVEKLTSRSYVIQAENGNHYCKNRVHIRPNMSKRIQYNDIDLYDVLPSSKNTNTNTNIPAS